MDTWAVINETAATLGVKARTRQKWRQRGVPHRWRIPIIAALREQKGHGIDLRAFDRRYARRNKRSKRKTA